MNSIAFLKAERDPATGLRGEWEQVAGDPEALRLTHTIYHLHRGDPKREVIAANPKPIRAQRLPAGERHPTLESIFAPSSCVGHQCRDLPLSEHATGYRKVGPHDIEATGG